MVFVIALNKLLTKLENFYFQRCILDVNKIVVVV